MKAFDTDHLATRRAKAKRIGKRLAVTGAAGVAALLLATGNAPSAMGALAMGSVSSAPWCLAGEHGGGVGLPGAWLSAEAGDHRLAVGHVCWYRCGRVSCSGACATPRPATVRTDIPRIAVRAGETVVFALAFRPRELTLSFRSGSTVERVQFPASRRVGWTVPTTFETPPEGLLVVLHARSPRPTPGRLGRAGRAGGDVQYLAWLVRSAT